FILLITCSQYSHSFRNPLLVICNFLYIFARPPMSTLFPYTTLFRSSLALRKLERSNQHLSALAALGKQRLRYRPRKSLHESSVRDRKSTRLNSSHLGTSYAVFCLKKKIRHHDYDQCFQSVHLLL